MADISIIQLSDNTQYNIKDAQARQDIATINEEIGDIETLLAAI